MLFLRNEITMERPPYILNTKTKMIVICFQRYNAFATFREVFEFLNHYWSLIKFLKMQNQKVQSSLDLVSTNIKLLRNSLLSYNYEVFLNLKISLYIISLRPITLGSLSIFVNKTQPFLFFMQKVSKIFNVNNFF